MELLNGNGSVPQSTSGYVLHTIASSTNTSPIAVTFSAPHPFNEGDTIEIEGHAINTNANGVWRAHVSGASTVTLFGSTGNGVGGATGYATDYSVNPLLQVGDDGDAASGSNLNTPYEGLFNFIPWLYQRVGTLRIYDTQRITLGTRGNSLSTTTTSTTAGTFGALGSLGDLLAAPPTTKYLTATDHLRLTFQASALVSGGADTSIGFGVRIAGGSLTFFPETSVYVGQGGAGHVIPFTLSYDYFNTLLTTPSIYNISIGACSENNGTGATVQIVGAAVLLVQHLRGNA